MRVKTHLVPSGECTSSHLIALVLCFHFLVYFKLSIQRISVNSSYLINSKSNPQVAYSQYLYYKSLIEQNKSVFNFAD